jgi:VPDSG-CTERM motif
MNKLKYIVAVLIALAGLGLQQAKADTIYSLSVGNSALTGASPSFTGPYGTVDVHLVDSTHATVTFTGLTQVIGGTTYQYLFGDGGSVDVNVNATSWTISGITGTNSGTGFTPGAFTDSGSKNIDGFGVMNQTVTDFDGYTHSANVVSFTLQNTGGTWASDSTVLIGNAKNGAIVTAHIFVTTFPANSTNSAIVTGFAANGGAFVPDGGTTVMLLGAALGALGMARRFLMS